MGRVHIPVWMQGLSDADLNFIKRFVLCSGSIKDMSEAYGVSYPTMRDRLDRLIEKICLSDREKDDSYIRLVRRMTIDGMIGVETAATLISAYRETKKGA